MYITGKMNFERVEIAPCRRTHSPKRRATIWFSGRKMPNGKEQSRRLYISVDLVEKSGFKAGDRVDLMQCGKLFAFQKGNAGLFTLTKTSANSTSSLGINSQNLCAHLSVETRGCREYDAWVDGDMIVFKPKEQ